MMKARRPAASWRRAHEALRDLGHLVGIEPAIAAQAAGGVVVDHDIAHRAVALGLDDQPALELQAGADQGGQGAGLAQQVGDRLGIVVTGQHLVDRRAQAHGPAAHGQALDLEGGNEVVGSGVEGGLGGDVGHGEAR
jgi:hypothetical protein